MELTTTIRPVRVARMAETLVPAYQFEGDWDDLDRGVVEAALRQCLPPMVDRMFNNWRLMCLAGRFVARRELWDVQAIYARDAGSLARKLLRHHGKVA